MIHYIVVVDCVLHLDVVEKILPVVEARVSLQSVSGRSVEDSESHEVTSNSRTNHWGEVQKNKDRNFPERVGGWLRK